MVSNKKSVSRSQKQLSNCPDCGMYVDIGIECFRCGFWFHSHCECLSDDVFSKYSDPKFNDWTWFCRKCSGEMFVKIGELEAKVKDYDNILKRLDTIESRLKSDSVDKKLNELHESIERMEHQHVNDIACIKTELVSFSTDHEEIKAAAEVHASVLQKCIDTHPKTDPIIREVLRETDDRIRRSRNILLLNAPEPVETSSASRRKADRDLAEAVIRKVSPDGDIKICHTHRIGLWNSTKSTAKQRPLLVVLKNSTQRDAVLQKSFLIKREMKPLCIRSDYTRSFKENFVVTPNIISEASSDYVTKKYPVGKTPKNGQVPRIKHHSPHHLS